MAKLFKKINKSIKDMFLFFWDHKSSISNRRFIATTWHVYLLVSLLGEQFLKYNTPDKTMLATLTLFIWGFYFAKGPHKDTPQVSASSASQFSAYTDVVEELKQQFGGSKKNEK